MTSWVTSCDVLITHYLLVSTYGIITYLFVHDVLIMYDLDDFLTTYSWPTHDLMS